MKAEIGKYNAGSGDKDETHFEHLLKPIFLDMTRSSTYHPSGETLSNLREMTMTDIDPTQAEADALLAMKKVRVTDTQYDYPSMGVPFTSP